MYYSAMFFITIDRLVACCLTVMYPAYCNSKRACYILLGTTIIAVALYVMVELFDILIPHINIPWLVTSFFYLPCDCLFVFTAVTTYTIIFYKYTTSVRRRTTTVLSVNSQQQSSSKPNSFDVLKNSKFYVSALLILTFFLLVVLVDVGYVVLYKKNNGEVTKRQIGIIRTFYTTSFLFDALIYIFLQPHMRRMLGGLVARVRRLGRRGSSITPDANRMGRIRKKVRLEISPAVVTKCNQ